MVTLFIFMKNRNSKLNIYIGPNQKRLFKNTGERKTVVKPRENISFNDPDSDRQGENL